MKFDSEMHEGYLMGILDSIETIFKKLLTSDDIIWVVGRLNKWVDDELESRKCEKHNPKN